MPDKNSDKPNNAGDEFDEARRQLMQDRLDQLDNAIADVLKSGQRDLKRQAVMLCEQTYDLGLHITAAQARDLLMDGKPCGEPVSGWDKAEDKTLDLYGGAPLWGNLLLAGGINLLTAAPKVGKTALMVHLIGCVFRGETHCLGAPIHDRFDHAVIVGTDMAVVGWADLFVREGLARYAPNNDNRMTRRRMAWIDERITLWSSESEIQLNSRGLARIREELVEHPNSLLLVDTLRSVTTGLGLDEYRPEIAQPVFALREAVAGLNVTTVVNHHENKTGAGLGAVAGSSALVGAVDAICSMRWLTPCAEGVEQIDQRRVLSATGRFRGGSLICELTESFDEQTEVLTTCWRGEGQSAKEVMAKEARFKAIGELQGRDLKVMETIWALWEVEQFATMPVIKERCGLAQKMAENTVNKLLRRGLIERSGTASGGMSGRPCVRYKPVEDEWEGVVPVDGRNPFRYHGDTGSGPSSPIVPLVPSVREDTRAGAHTRALSVDPSERLPELGSLVSWKGQPALVLDHKGTTEVVVTQAVQIKGEWIAKNSQLKAAARWGMEAKEYTPEPSLPQVKSAPSPWPSKASVPAPEPKHPGGWPTPSLEALSPVLELEEGEYLEEIDD